jgi:hypothetical protein
MTPQSREVKNSKKNKLQSLKLDDSKNFLYVALLLSEFKDDL